MKSIWRSDMRRLIVCGLLGLLMVAAVQAQWMHDSTEDLMSGEITPLTLTVADAYQGTLGAPVLVIRGGDDVREVYVYWGGYMMDGDLRHVLYRAGDDPADSCAVVLSTTEETTFFAEPRTMLALMLEHDGEQLVVQAPRATGVDSVARFSLVGLQNAVHTLDKAASE